MEQANIKLKNPGELPPPLPPPTPTNMGHNLWGVERVSHFVNVHLHCIVSNSKKISKMSMLHPPGKVFADAREIANLLYVLAEKYLMIL